MTSPIRRGIHRFQRFRTFWAGMTMNFVMYFLFRVLACGVPMLATLPVLAGPRAGPAFKRSSRFLKGALDERVTLASPPHAGEEVVHVEVGDERKSLLG